MKTVPLIKNCSGCLRNKSWLDVASGSINSGGRFERTVSEDFETMEMYNLVELFEFGSPVTLTLNVDQKYLGQEIFSNVKHRYLYM